jgi:O-antigen/teichoic acid export membrane protein
MITYIKNVAKLSIFRELSWYTFCQIFVQGAAFFSAVIVMRYLGPTNLGLYGFVQNYVATALTVVGGMDFYFTWKIAKSDNYFRDVQEYIGYKLYLYIFFSIIGISSAWIALPNDIAFMVSIMLIPVFLQSLNAFSFYAMATNRAKLVSTVLIISSTVLLVIKVSLVFLQAPLYSFVIVSALDLILNGIILTIYFMRFPEWKNLFSSLKVPSFLSSFNFLYSIRLSIVALVCWQLLQRIDQLILATFSNAYTLGIYGAAVKIAEVPNFLAGVLSAALISRIAHVAVQHDVDVTVKGNLKKMMLSYLIVGSAISLGIIIFAPLAIHILYGKEFIQSVPVLQAYALSIPGMFLNYFFLGMYGARDRQRYQVAIFLSALVINVILIYALTPVWGLVGTAIATAVAYSISAFSFYINLETKK